MSEHMIDPIHAAFKRELGALTRRYGALELSAEDHWQGYPECGQDIRMTVAFHYPIDDLDLGRWFIEERQRWHTSDE